MRAAARVASILSIERDLSVARPANSRAFAGLASATYEHALVFLLSSALSSSCIALGLSVSAVGGPFGKGIVLSSKYGMARSVVSEGALGLCHVILFSSFVVGFGFEHVASAYASSRSSLFVI